MSKSFSLSTRLRGDQHLSGLLLIVFLLLQGSFIKAKQIPLAKFYLIDAQPVPIRRTSDLAQLNLEDHNLAFIGANSFYVMDVDSGAILAEKNATQTLYPASTTKMMTALVAQELYNLEETIVVPPGVKEQGNGMRLIAGEEMTVKNLLYGLLIPSANDAAFTLASHYFDDQPLGSEVSQEAFVEKMNLKAQELHLDNTHFNNSAGFDDENQVSTARDLAILARELIKDDFFAQIVATSEMTVTDITGQIIHPLKNTNQLLGVENGVIGVKTGTTLLAGEVLVTLVERDGHPIIIALLASSDRFSETTQIIDWVYASYEWKE